MDQLGVTTAPRGPGRPAIPLERIIDAALQIIDADGADALSLRTLATRLSSSTSTLYRHISGRAELVELVLDRMIGDAAVRAGNVTELPWTEACRHISTSLFDVLSQHGRAAALLAETLPTGPNAMAVRESMLDVLLRAGLDQEGAIRAVATIGHYVVGFAMQAPDPTAPARDHAAVRSAIDPSRFPRTASVAQFLPRPLAEEFLYGLDLLLRGLADELAPRIRK